MPYLYARIRMRQPTMRVTESASDDRLGTHPHGVHRSRVKHRNFVGSRIRLEWLLGLVWIKGISKVIHRNPFLWKGIYAVWNEGNFNSKTKKSFLPPFISRKTKHPVQTNGFTKTETAREEKQKIMLLPAFFLCYGFLRSKHPF